MLNWVKKLKFKLLYLSYMVGSAVGRNDETIGGVLLAIQPAPNWHITRSIPPNTSVIVKSTST